MKKIIITSLALIVLASCKKDRKCTCTDNINKVDYKITIYKSTKNVAKSQCVSHVDVDTKGNIIEDMTCTLE